MQNEKAVSLSIDTCSIPLSNKVERSGKSVFFHITKNKMKFNLSIFIDLLIVTALVIAVHSYENSRSSKEGPPGRMHIANSFWIIYTWFSLPNSQRCRCAHHWEENVRRTVWAEKWKLLSRRIVYFWICGAVTDTANQNFNLKIKFKSKTVAS